jgi:hypothetical protein
VTGVLQGQTAKTKVFVADVKGPNEFMNERFKSLFMEELLKLKTITITTVKPDADFLLEASGSVEMLQQSQVSANKDSLRGAAGGVANALVSAKLLDSKSALLFVGNKSSTGGGFYVANSKDATEDAVDNIVSDIKKKMKWR